MDNDEHKPADDFLPASTRGEEARGILVNLLAGAIEVGTGLPGVGSFMSAGYGMLGLVRSNMNDAGKAFADVVAAHADEFKKLNDRVTAGETERELLNRRLTVTQRAIHEAGRHPNKVLREALGAFGARVQITDEDELLVFEVVDVLSRMTALDYDYLELVVECDDNRKTLLLDPDSDAPVLLKMHNDHGGIVFPEAAGLALRGRYPWLGRDARRIVAVELRLIVFGLIFDRKEHSSTVGGTALGRAVLALSRRAPA